MLEGFKVKIFIIFVLLILPISVFAHPGRTDANGCHVCRSNCERWGLSNGEYHCHNKPAPIIKQAKTEARIQARASVNTTAKIQAKTSSPSTSQITLRVHFIDVGQGDSILIDFGKNELLIDGGEKSSQVGDYINPYVEGPLEVMIATHPHTDHIGGLVEVLKDFKVKEIWLNGDIASSKTYEQFMSAVTLEGADVYTAKEGKIISFGNLNFSIFNPPDSLFSDINNNSIVLKLKYGNIAFLFTGDAEKEAESSILNNTSNLQSQILKAGHHCSKTSSSGLFLLAVKPKEVICMVGENNRYGHPHQETLQRLKEIGANIYRTDINGTIIVSTDGKAYQIKAEK